MCGIVGLVLLGDAAGSSDGPESIEAVEAMRDTMRHRGPDDAGASRRDGSGVLLGQRRLAIIDLSPAGHQPMQDAAGELEIVFNGEIYNHRELRRELQRRGHAFRSRSDTEVILAAYREWGDECLPRLNGMFAFALFDSARRRLLVARDRAGEKPLFYAHSPGRFAFASELKALMADPSLERRLDPQALDCYLAYGFVPGDRCILRGVRKLPQGHALTLDLDTGEARVRPWWTLPDARPDPRADADELTAELERLLLESVRLRLVADVPVGVMLSGGVDSSLITALAARASSSPVRTFTISFPGHGGYDEAAHARLVARHFGTRHVELAAEPATVELLPELAAQYDEPLADSSMVPTLLVSRLIREHATVALGGDGGDELFAGYPHYRWLGRQDQWRQRIPAAIRALIGGGASRLLPVGFRGRNHLIGLSGDAPRGIAHVNLYFDAATRRRLLAPLYGQRLLKAGDAEGIKADLCRSGSSVLRQATAVDFQTYLVDDILVKVDRASMLASLEVRAPFLDPALIEFAFTRIPDHLRADERGLKILPRRLAERLLPPQFDRDRKQGFSIPLAKWFRGDWGRFIESVLSEADRDLFESFVIRKLIAGQRRGYANTQRLFALTMFELWRRHYRVTL